VKVLTEVHVIQPVKLLLIFMILTNVEIAEQVFGKVSSMKSKLCAGRRVQ
jgi:hypothetical protein